MGALANHILALHGWVALVVLFAVPALESSAFVGFIFPGEIAVLLGGVLAFQHRVSLPAAIAATVTGAIIGDSIGYEVGKRWGRTLLHGTVGRFVKHEHLDKAENYLATKGGKAVFLGRFTAALRVLIPGMAGMSGLRYGTFLAYNVAGGGLWATGFVLLGFAAGGSWRKVEHLAKRASLLLLLLLAVVGLIVLSARWVLHHQDRLRSFATRQLARTRVARVRRRYEAQFLFLSERIRPGGAFGLSLTLSLLVLGALGWALGIVVKDVVTGQSARFDGPVLAFFARHREHWLTTAMQALTVLGSAAFLLPAILVAGGAWWLRRRSWRPLVLLGAAYLGSFALFQSVKFLTHRQRPPLTFAVSHFGGFAFPSGHAAQSAAVWGMAGALVALGASTWSRKVIAWTLAGLVAVMVGVTRLYLGAHWMTDVVGGWAAGALWLAVLLATARILPQVRSRSGQGPGSTAEPSAGPPAPVPS